ncbi:hypothetical protein KFL_005410065 [Klebsormidium nitens]|uniref:Uncharacterized protein n=1 Tax=Klebsormidium nitens TaxID=105231 RepID=A0A1Y1ILU7_KLENI|nr:hypothetical protein KFL_005410065 [Klebsormidium nitens]|eukprot:GAQ89607.1 hypothetical protein KFL_005410065 [Klebsormidium nitens]
MAASSMLSCAAQPASLTSLRAGRSSSFMGDQVRTAPVALRRSQNVAASFKPRVLVAAAGGYQSGPRTAKDQGAGIVPKAVATSVLYFAAPPAAKVAPLSAAAEVPTSSMPSRYYMQLAQALGVDPSGFQALKTPVSLGTTSKELWDQMDRIPNKVMFGSLGGKVNFHQAYKNIVAPLNPGDDGSAFEAAMGDQLDEWYTYKKTAKGKITPAVFNAWADKNFNGDATEVEEAFLSMTDDPIKAALDVVHNPKNFATLYETDIKALKSMLNGGSAINFTFDNQGAAIDLSSAYAHTESDDRFLWWGSDTSTTATSLSSKIANAKVTVTVSYGKVVSVPVSAKTTWFDSSVMATALNGDSTIWKDPTSQTNFFGNGADQEGQVPRVINSIYVVRGPFKITTTMEADWSDDERSYFQQNISGGFWPFYSSSSKTIQNTVDTCSKTQITATSFNSDSGTYKVLGAQISDIRSAFS